MDSQSKDTTTNGDCLYGERWRHYRNTVELDGLVEKGVIRV